MAKISVSLPDELKDQLDAYAAETGFKRSEAVAHVLTAFFAGEIQEPTPIDPKDVENMNHYLALTMDYLEALHEQDPQMFPKPEWVEDDPDSEPVIRSLIGRLRR
jgi:hypothetical protein